MKKYFTITLKSNMTAVVHTHKSPDLDLSFLQEQVGGYIEVIQAYFHRNPSMRDLRMVVNEEGQCHYYPINALGSFLYDGTIVVGDVVICSTYNPDPDAEPDIYAMRQSQFDEVMEWINSFVIKINITEVAV